MTDTRATDLGVDRLRLVRRGLLLVDALTFSVAPGQVLGVSGASGAGKTTLLRAIAGLTDDYGGTVERPDGPLGMVFQEARLLPWLTAHENVLLPVDRSRADRFFWAEEWLERVGLADAAGLYPHQMSGGMRQRVAIARALAVGPRLLLVDEPFSALDKPLAAALRDELMRLVRDHAPTTVWVSHEDGELDAVSDRRLHLDGPPGTWTLS
ncbi:ATP-binding cassette domain-containing protein [Actinomyces sp. B33]|uniref:ABC transporter ATP-binding protein n=1 Tax=Actinomyces sp. B33 TaxID=2942131 RepID=UPI00233FC9E8|nr:ATP-binding cassette domain-containing protein [Actinomyces sp. B33]MDC4232703.1 ATP-binding cassette domain-containing protein [Actinomyces sp. B33]